MQALQQADFDIPTLGPCTKPSPIGLNTAHGDKVCNFVHDRERIMYDVYWDDNRASRYRSREPLTMELAGPREKIFFNPVHTRVAIVTCGGLCPGINNVIRSLVMTLNYRYGVREIVGIRYGYRGFIPEYGHPLMQLTPKSVAEIHQFGGTILGSSRGQQDVCRIVDFLEQNQISILFTVGGDGTQRGALEISREIQQRGLHISVAGIPKTIDNDISIIEKTFGFETSFTMASPIIRDAHNEASGAFNGVAIVKLMGRDSGFIAANAALSMPEVNLVLVPELEFDLFGEKGLLKVVERRLEQRRHCLIVVAEGAGQSLFGEIQRHIDASGNVLHEDIGILLRDSIRQHFQSINTEVTVKYIDPSYIIRSAPANPSDSIFCNKLSINAVHGAMAGRTGFVVGRRNNKFVYLPIELVIRERKKIDIEGDLWLNVLETTGQPISMKNAPQSEHAKHSLNK